MASNPSVSGIGGINGQNAATTASSLFAVCSALVGESDGLSNYGQEYSTLRILQCVSNNLENESTQRASSLTSWLLVIAGALVFVMQVGFAMLCAGCVRRKNVQK